MSLESIASADGGSVDPSQPCYAIGTPLSWRELDGQWVAYHEQPPSMTELDAFGAALLFLIEERPSTSVELAQGIAHLVGESDGGMLLRRVEDELRWLTLGGFVERVT